MGAAGTDSKPAPVLPILIAMVAGALTGWLLGPDAAIGDVKLLPIFDLLGTLFINLLKMLIVPLILASVITGVAALGTGPDLGRLGGKTLGVLRDHHADRRADRAGAGQSSSSRASQDGEPVRDLLALSADAAQVTEGVMSRADTSVLDSIRAVVPANIVAGRGQHQDAWAWCCSRSCSDSSWRASRSRTRARCSVSGRASSSS